MVVLACVFFGALKYPCHHVTEGFSLFRITNPLPEVGPFCPPELSSVEKKQLLEILSQPFYYLSCGGQSYVFVSQNQEYVIKFVKFQRVRVAPWLQHLPLPKTLANNRSLKAQKKERVLRKAFQSYVTAYTFFKEETGVIYHHLQQTKDLQSHVILFDNLGYRYEIDLDKYAFTVQKKGETTAEVLKCLIEEGKIKEAAIKLDQLVQFTVDAARKGIEDHDLKFKANLGFIHGQVMQLDIGSLRYNNQPKDPSIYKAQIYQAGRKFSSWLEKHQPLLVESFEESLYRVCEVSEQDANAL